MTQDSILPPKRGPGRPKGSTVEAVKRAKAMRIARDGKLKPPGKPTKARRKVLDDQAKRLNKLGRVMVQTVKDTSVIDINTDAPVATRVSVPDVPYVDRYSDPQQWDDQQMARIEMLMLKGVTEPRVLQQMLQMPDRNKIIRWIDRIHVKWATVGGGQKLKRYRGEAMNKLDLVQSELWVMANGMRESDSRGYIVAMQQIMAAIRFQGELSGLTPQAIERMNMAEDGANPAMQAIAKNERLMQVFMKYAEHAGITKSVMDSTAMTIAESDGNEDLVKDL